MNKTYAMLLVLTLGAPAAAGINAPQLPLIDAAVVRSQPFEKESVNIGAAFPGMQTCGFTAANGKTCVFTCKDGSTVNRPAIVSSLVPNGCAKFVMVQAGGPKSAVDLTVTIPLQRAKLDANNLRTIALALPGLRAPKAYTQGVQEVSEAINEGLLDIDTAIKQGDHAWVHFQAGELERQTQRLADLARSIERDVNYSAWAGPQVLNLAAQLGRNLAEVRQNSPLI